MSDVVKDYLNSIARFPLLTPQQEIQLGRRVARWVELKSKKNLTESERRELRSGERARQQFINSNLQLVVHVARKYDKRRKTMEFIDLIQEGNIGLSRAVELFDYSRGYKFSTYAYWWIRQAITRALICNDPIIRLPIGVHEQLMKLNRIMEELSQSMGRVPSIAELATAMDMEAKALSLLMKQSYTVTSLDIAISNNTNILEMIAKTIDQEDSAPVEELKSYMNLYLDDLTKHVIQARMATQPLSWTQIEAETGCKRDRLQDIYKRGINRLRMLMGNPLDGTPLGTNNQTS